MSGLRRSLQVSGFPALLIAYVINRAGDVVGALALAVIVLHATGSAIATALLFLATQFLPGLIGPAFVSRIERSAPGRTLPRMYLAECGLFLVLAALAPASAVGAIVLVAFVEATLAFGGRAMIRSATASVLMPHDLMPEGKAAFNIALAAAMVAGPLIAGLAISFLGPALALVIDGGSFCAAALLIARAPALRERPCTEAARGGARYRVREGLRYIAANRDLRAVILGEGLAFVFFYLVVPVTVVYAARSLHAGAGGYSAILAAWGIGIAIGSLLHVRLIRRIGPTMILLSTFAVAVGYLGTAAAPTLAFACLASVAGGLGNGTQWASVETTLHQLVDEEFRARTAAVLESLAAIAPGAGIVLGGALTALFSPRAAYLAAGLGLVVLVAAGVASRIGSAARLSVNRA